LNKTTYNYDSFSCTSGNIVFDFQEVHQGSPTRRVRITIKKKFGFSKETTEVDFFLIQLMDNNKIKIVSDLREASRIQINNNTRYATPASKSKVEEARQVTLAVEDINTQERTIQESINLQGLPTDWDTLSENWNILYRYEWCKDRTRLTHDQLIVYILAHLLLQRPELREEYTPFLNIRYQDLNIAAKDKQKLNDITDTEERLITIRDQALSAFNEMRLFQDLKSVDNKTTGVVLKYYRMNNEEILESMKNDFIPGGKKMKSRKNKRKTRHITKQNKPKDTRR
jgi:hypothetical protein